MLRRTFFLIAALSGITMLGSTRAADLTAGMQKGTPELKSAGPITFAPQNILLVGDTKGATIFAIATGDTASGSPSQPVNIEKIDEKIAGMLGTTSKDILINHMAVNPATGSTFLSVSRGKGPDATPVIIRVDSNGKLSELALKDVMFSKAELPNPTQSEKVRQDVTTDLQFADGKILVAGLSNEEFASTLRVIPFPFNAVDKGTGVEIWHSAHGMFETKAPVRTFAVFDVQGQPNVLAAYTCTPLVKFPLSDLKPGAKVRGTTIAELGNRNKPLDMFVYKKGGKDYILMANSSRGVMKVSVENIDKTEGITAPVKGGGTAGLKYETIANLKRVDHLDRLDKDHALLLVRSDSGALNLQAVALP
jgi:hypothetical protein